MNHPSSRRSSLFIVTLLTCGSSAGAVSSAPPQKAYTATPNHIGSCFIHPFMDSMR